MAEAPKLDIDEATGTIRSGKFAGMSIHELGQYAEALDTAVSEGKEPPPVKKPDEKLNEHASTRVDAGQLFILQRLEQEDEAAFMAKVDDYGEYKDVIDAQKKAMHPAQRAQKNVHEVLYTYAKLQKKPELKAGILGTGKKAEETPPAEPVEEPKKEEEKKEEEKKPPTPPPAKPKAAAPVATPTPGGRQTPPAERKPKLTGNPKLEAFAARAGLTSSEYLLELEDRGMTQEDVDRIAAGASSASRPRASVYDRPRASS